jgi:hypothetical protein
MVKWLESATDYCADVCVWSVLAQALCIIEQSSSIDRTICFISEKTSVSTLAILHLSYFIISKVTNTVFNAHKRILMSEIFSIL